MSWWRVTAWLYQGIVRAILGPVHRLTGWFDLHGPTQYYFTDAPRKRPKQTVTALNLVAEVKVNML